MLHLAHATSCLTPQFLLEDKFCLVKVPGMIPTNIISLKIMKDEDFEGSHGS